MHSLCTPVTVTKFQGVTLRPRSGPSPIFMAINIFLDINLTIMVIIHMSRQIVKVDSGNSSFRIVIPRRLVEEMGWEHVEHVVIRKCSVRSIEIRSLLYDETDEG